MVGKDVAESGGSKYGKKGAKGVWVKIPDAIAVGKPPKMTSRELSPEMFRVVICHNRANPDKTRQALPVLLDEVIAPLVHDGNPEDEVPPLDVRPLFCDVPLTATVDVLLPRGHHETAIVVATLAMQQQQYNDGRGASASPTSDNFLAVIQWGGAYATRRLLLIRNGVEDRVYGMFGP